jgi:hypothetical protein
MNGYELTYEAVLPKLRDLDFRDVSRRLGFTYVSEDRMDIDFLGRPFTVSHGGVLCGEAVHINHRSVLIYYASSPADREPLEDFQMLHHFAGNLFSSDNTTSDWMTRSLRERYGADYPGFHRAALALGMAFTGSGKGAYHYRYQLLPRMPVKLTYIEADDEFPCEFRIYYDKTALDFVPFESLAVLNGCFIGALARVAEA